MLLLYDARVHKKESTLALGFYNLVEKIGPKREDQFLTWNLENILELRILD